MGPYEWRTRAGACEDCKQPVACGRFGICLQGFNVIYDVRASLIEYRMHARDPIRYEAAHGPVGPDDWVTEKLVGITVDVFMAPERNRPGHELSRGEMLRALELMGVFDV